MEPYQDYLNALQFERDRAMRDYKPILGYSVWRDAGAILAATIATTGGALLAYALIVALVRLVSTN